jgi:hypothetical protein
LHCWPAWWTTSATGSSQTSSLCVGGGGGGGGGVMRVGGCRSWGGGGREGGKRFPQGMTQGQCLEWCPQTRLQKAAGGGLSRHSIFVALLFGFCCVHQRCGFAVVKGVGWRAAECSNCTLDKCLSIRITLCSVVHASQCILSVGGVRGCPLCRHCDFCLALPRQALGLAVRVVCLKAITFSCCRAGSCAGGAARCAVLGTPGCTWVHGGRGGGRGGRAALSPVVCHWFVEAPL